jgi:acetyl-CoA synthetase
MTDRIEVTPRLDAYHLYEQEWDGYDDLRESFEWEVPETFNTATYVCDRWADLGGERTAVYAEDRDDAAREYTFSEVSSMASRLADFLRERGVGAGDRIAVNGTQRVENLATHLAAWKLGAVAVPLSILLGPDGLRFRLQNSEAVAYVADAVNLDTLREIRADCSDLETVLTVGGAVPEQGERRLADAVEGQDPAVGTAETDPEDPAYVIYTSGTTGEPKGVVLPHRCLLGGLPGILMGGYNLDIRPEDVSRIPVEWSWIGSLHLGILSALFYGVPIVAHAENQFDPEREFRLIETYEATITGGPATALRMMMQVPDRDSYDTGSVRTVVQGGESLGRSLYEAVTDTFENATMHEVYGQTEALIFVSDCAALGLDHEFGKMGKVVPGHEVRIQDPETGEPLDTGEVGEIALRVDGEDPLPFAEYWKRPEKTAEKVRDGWLRSEDLGSVDEDGRFAFNSRRDDVIISSGYKMGPAEIEETLADHDAVADAGVIGVPDDTRGEVPKAFVALGPGYDPGDDLRGELQAFVKDRLAKYEYPRELEFVEELPRTTTGKVRRHDLREREGLA